MRARFAPRSRSRHVIRTAVVEALEARRLLALVSIHDATITEGGTAAFRVTLSEPSPGNIGLAFFTADDSAQGGTGADYQNLNSSISIPAGATERFIFVNTFADNLIEGTERFFVVLDRVLFGDAAIDKQTAQGFILDANTGNVSFGSSSSAVSESAGSHSVFVNFSGNDGALLARPLGVTVFDISTGTAVPLVDYELPTNSLTFPAGTATGNAPFFINLIDNNEPEPDRTLFLALELPAGNTLPVTIGQPSTHEVTILDDDEAPTNRPPTATDNVYTTDSDTSLVGNVITDDTGAGADSDPDGDTIVVVAVNGEEANLNQLITLASGATLEVFANGLFIYSPNGAFDSLTRGQEDTDSFTYTISDSAETASATVTITIVGINHPPIAFGDTFTVDQDTTLNPLNVLANDVDPDGDILSVSAVTQSTQGGSVLIAPLGAGVLYSPPPGFVGQDSFSYTVSDGFGGSDTTTVLVNVRELANRPPDATNNAYTVNSNALLFGNVITDDTGAGADSDPDGDTITVTQVNGAPISATITLPSGATLEMSPNGTFVYSPNGAFDSLTRGQEAQDTFTYTISDGLDTASATVIITVVGVNRPPTAVTDSFTVKANTTLNPLDVLANDSDPDGDPLTITNVTQGANGGSVIIAPGGGGLLYAPPAGFTGTDSFTYTISDGHGGEDTTTVIVTVTEDDPTLLLDFGDAPAPYPTLLRDDGARHTPTGPTLGTRRDAEPDGQPNATATGDDLNPVGQPNDEDGLVRAILAAGCHGIFIVDVNNISGVAFLNIWVDFNADGDWDDDGEHVAVDHRVEENGQHILVFDVPAGASIGNTFTRMRISSLAGLAVLPTGPGGPGEVEDHLVQIVSLPPIVYVDHNWAGLLPGVDPDGPGPATAIGFDAFGTIQEGVHCVAVNGEVRVAPGTYGENVTIPKTLTLRGSGMQDTIVRPPERGDVITVAADDVFIFDLQVLDATRGIVAAGVRAPSLFNVASVSHTVTGFDGRNLTGRVFISGGAYQRNVDNGISLVDVADVVMENATVLLNRIGVFVRNGASFTDRNSTVRINRSDGIRLLAITGDARLTGTALDGNSRDGLFAGVGPDGAAFAIGGNLFIHDVEIAGGGQKNGVFVEGVGANVLIDNVNARSQDGSALELERVAGQLRINGGSFTTSFFGIHLRNIAGPVLITSVNASNNFRNLRVDGLPQTLQISGGTYSDAQQAGIFLRDVTGGITLSGLTAEKNSINLEIRSELPATGPISVLHGSYGGASALGIEIVQRASSVSLVNVKATGNGAQNLRAGLMSLLSVSGGDYGGSTDSGGISIFAVEQAELNNVKADRNRDANLFVDQARILTVNNGSFSQSTQSSGIRIDKSPFVTLNKVTANRNRNDNATITDARSVTIERGSYSNSVLGRGINVEGAGGAQLLRIVNAKASDNLGGDGIRIRSFDNVTLDRLTTVGNFQDGINVALVNQFRGFRLQSSRNGGDGLQLSVVTTALVEDSRFIFNRVGIRVGAGVSFSQKKLTLQNNTEANILFE